MTRIAIQVPVKARQSERCAGKNFRELEGVPLASRKLIELMVKAPDDWDIWVDTEDFNAISDVLNKHIALHLDSKMLQVHDRHPAYAEDWCNGMQLLNQFVTHHPDYDWYGQAFVTAPFLSVETMVKMAEALIDVSSCDSALTVYPQRDMVWHDGKPVNHDPRRLDGEVRTQDMATVRATHGFYLVRGDVARRTGCRTGGNPLLWEVSEREAFDIDTEEDFARAEEMLAKENGCTR